MGSQGGRAPCNWEMILFLKYPSLGFVKGRASVCLACECSLAQGTEPCRVSFWFSIQHDRQASSFILSEGTPGHAAFYCCDCSVAQATLGPWGTVAPDRVRHPLFPPFHFWPAGSDQVEVSSEFLLQKPGAQGWGAGEEEGGGGTILILSLRGCHSLADVQAGDRTGWGVGGQQLNWACCSWRTGIPGTLLIKQPQTTLGLLTVPTLLSCYLLDSWSCQFRTKFPEEVFRFKSHLMLPIDFYFFLGDIRESVSSDPPG